MRLAEAVAQGLQALNGERKSLPSLLMVGRDLTKVLKERYPAEPETRDYLDRARHAHCASRHELDA